MTYWELWLSNLSCLRFSIYTRKRKNRNNRCKERWRLIFLHKIRKKKKNIYIYIYTIMYTMCPPGCYHNGFMATPELGHRMYGYIYIYIYIGSVKCLHNERLPVRGSKDTVSSPNFISLCKWRGWRPTLDCSGFNDNVSAIQPSSG